MGEAGGPAAQEGRGRMKPWGVFEKVPGTGVWWIRFADSSGRIRREKAGTKGAAIKLYAKRKTEALMGEKLPESLRQAPAISFSDLVRIAREHAKVSGRPGTLNAAKVKKLQEWFGNRSADSITP